METLIIFAVVIAWAGSMLTFLFWLTDWLNKHDRQEHLGD
jgi:hypothetical protein